ncbi:hypothetical protein B0T09DRAFT_337096 [Sordaria sp. MPI-SDFR-AT-0083]|nr:hypothetical protein B0T09DRAFT_337096 [Sordaria sp. MPI-SDFR-AT-0083]
MSWRCFYSSLTAAVTVYGSDGCLNKTIKTTTTTNRVCITGVKMKLSTSGSGTRNINAHHKNNQQHCRFETYLDECLHGLGLSLH